MIDTQVVLELNPLNNSVNASENASVNTPEHIPPQTSEDTG